jgi:MoxR-like ATPase
MDLFKVPGIAETIDWAKALAALDAAALDAQTVDATLGALLKYQDDVARVRGERTAAIVREVLQETAA